MLAHDLAKRRVRARLPEGQAAPDAFDGPGRPAGKPVAKVTDERGLADARLTDDGDEPGLTAVRNTQVQVLKPCQLLFAADEVRRALLRMEGGNAEKRTTNDACGLPLRLDRRLGPEIEGGARVRDRART